MNYEEALQERLVRTDDIPISMELGRSTALAINKNVDLSAVSFFVIRPTDGGSSLVGLNKDFLQVVNVNIPFADEEKEPPVFQETIEKLRKQRKEGSSLSLAKNLVYAMLICGGLALLFTIGIVIYDLIMR